MGHFDRFANDTLHKINANGERVLSFKCQLVEGKANIFNDLNGQIDEGDILEREVPGGRVERYRVKSADWTQGFGGLPSTWKLALVRADRPAPQPESPRVVITHSNNVQVGSGNAMTVQTSVEAIIRLIDSANAPLAQKQEAKTLLSQILKHPLICSLVGGTIPSALQAALS